MALANAGVDPEQYRAHSTWSAKQKRGVPLQTILKAGSWASEAAFAKIDKKDVRHNSDQVCWMGFFTIKSKTVLISWFVSDH